MVICVTAPGAIRGVNSADGNGRPLTGSMEHIDMTAAHDRIERNERVVIRELDLADAGCVGGGFFLAGCVHEYRPTPVELFLEGFYSTCGCSP